MEQIIITKPNGSIVPIAKRSAATEIKQAKQTWELLGSDLVNISIESVEPQTYGIGDKITAFGRAYKLNRLPTVHKNGTRAFVYDLEFEGVQYDLMRATYDLTIDTTTNQLQDVQADSLTGDLRRFATVLIANACRVFPGKWVLGTLPDTKTITLTFNESDNCLSVLQNLCSEENFNVEFEIIQSSGICTINFKNKVGQIFPYTFQFGKGKGLYSLDRQNVDSSNIVTRLKVYGSTDNITNKYRALRLCLPGKTKSQSYIEKQDAVEKYGIYEATKYFDDIKPTFNGSVTGIFSDSVLKFIDTKMFDLNEKETDGVTTKYLIDGTSAKVHFNTGNLAGYEFEVHEYDHATHTFTLVKQTDDRGDVFPSDKSTAFQFAIGDEYKLIDVALPDTYEQAAEAELANEGNTYYDQNSQPKVQYGLSITKSFLEKMVGNGSTVNIFQPGDYIPIKDVDIDVDKSVRVKSLTRNLLDEYDYTLTISDTVTTNITNRVISELTSLDKIVSINNLKNPVRARSNWRTSQELLNMVFDPEGDYYTGKIKPNSIETLALSVGAKSMQFGLTNTSFEPNYSGDKDLIKVTGGVLTHYTISEDTIRSWTLANNETIFESESAYYIYAKCQRVGTAGSIIFSTSQIKVEQDVNYYHFWIGVVNSVDSEMQVRSISLTYGFSTVNGRFIKTGRIESSGGSGSFFDLDDNEFRVGDENKGLAWNIGGNGKFVLKGTMVQSDSGITQPLGCFRGSYVSENTYYKGDEVTYNGSTYRYIYNTPISNVLPTNTTYWDVIASKGVDGTNGVNGDDGVDGAYFEYRYAKNGSTSTPPALTVTDNNPSGWTSTMPTIGTSEYLWMTVAKKTATGILVQNWSTPIRTSGIQGETGAKGDKGDSPSLVFRGVYNAATTYYGLPQRVDAVKYNDVYYVARTDAGNFAGILPTDTSKWNSFGSSFNSVATGLLLAELAYIENLIINRMSTGSDDSLPRLLANSNEIGFYKNKAGESSTNNALLRLGIAVGYMATNGTSKPGISVRDRDDDNSYSEMTSEGVFTNGSNINALPVTAGISSCVSMAALLQHRVAGDQYLGNSLNAAIYGNDQTGDSDAVYSEGYGGYFNKLKANGLYIGCRVISSSTTLTKTDVFVSCYNTSEITISMPANPYTGEVIMIRRNNSNVVANGNGKSILNTSVLSSINVGEGQGDIGLFIYDGSYWTYNYMGRKP